MPFVPESEAMTIKRIDVAIKKEDSKLLKEGAQKLYEKYHTGHQFEQRHELENLLKEVKTKHIQNDVRDLLVTTIENILNNRFEEIEVSFQEEEKYAINQSIALFYDDPHPVADFVKIKRYRDKLNTLFLSNEKNIDYDFLKEISQINNAVDTQVSGIDKILSMMKSSKFKTSLITSSQSQNILRTLYEKKVDFELASTKNLQYDFSQDNSGLDFIPLLGLSNMYICPSCNFKTFSRDFSVKTVCIQCSNCENIAFPDLYPLNPENPLCNPIFWQKGLSAFINSKVWFIINPPLDENKEIIFDFLKTAATSSRPEEIYILSKENDKKDIYKKMFEQVLVNTTIRTDFHNEMELCQNFLEKQLVT